MFGGVFVELYEKIQELRKSKHMTQEQLAQELYVSRTAISKWESNRGYPSIESLRALSKFFNVSIDDLLSTETIINIVDKKEKKQKSILLGVFDLLHILFIFLPLYPKVLQNVVYSVNLLEYISRYQCLYIFLYFVLIVLGIIQMLFKKLKIAYVSLFVSIITICVLVLSRQTYATFLCFLIFLFKMCTFHSFT